MPATITPKAARSAPGSLIFLVPLRPEPVLGLAFGETRGAVLASCYPSLSGLRSDARTPRPSWWGARAPARASNPSAPQLDQRQRRRRRRRRRDLDGDLGADREEDVLADAAIEPDGGLDPARRLAAEAAI